MIAQRKSHCRSVSLSVVGLNSSTAVTPTSARSVQPSIASGANASHPRLPLRCFSAESLHVIPQTKDVESQFQAVLGKCLFEKAVQSVEEEEEENGRPTVPRPPCSARPVSSGSAGSSRAGSSYGSSGCHSPKIPGGRTLTIRPTRCESPLVKGSRSFDSYINKGSVDALAVAKTRGPIDSPKPSIHRYLRRVRTVSEQELNQFSLKEEFTDKGPENDREMYWRRKKEEKILEEELKERKRQEKAEMLVILNEMKKEYDERKAEEAERLRIKLEEERIAKEKEEELALLERLENQSILDDVSSVVSSSSKSSKKRSSKKGRSKGKNTKRGKSPTSRKSAKRKSAVTPSRVDEGASQGSGRNTPQPILKDTRPSDVGSGDTSRGKRVTFREKLVSSRTIRPHKPVSPRKGSPKKAFPGSTSSEAFSPSPIPGEKKKKRTSGGSKGKRGGSAKGSKKGSKKKATVEPAPPVEAPKEPEPAVTSEPEPVVEPAVEPVSEEVEPPVLVADEPPEFCPAGEYKTRRQMVEEWLYYRSCSAHSRAHPPIL